MATAAQMQEARIRGLLATYRRINLELQKIKRGTPGFVRLARQHRECVVELDELLREDALI